MLAKFSEIRVIPAFVRVVRKILFNGGYLRLGEYPMQRASSFYISTPSLKDHYHGAP